MTGTESAKQESRVFLPPAEFVQIYTAYETHPISPKLT